MSISSHLEMKYVAGFLFYVTRYYVPISLSVITAVVTTKWDEAPAFLIVVVIASNILLLLRVYALYNRSKWIFGYLSSVIVIQFAVATLVSAFSDESLPVPPIDIAVFQEYTPLILELTLDVSIVALIIAKSWKDRSLNGLRDQGVILRIVVKDGIIYFLVIFSTMFIRLCMGLFAPPALKVVNAGLVSIMINRLTINLHRSVKGNRGTSLTLSAVPHTTVPFLPTWMINTQDYSSSSDIDKAAIRDVGDLALFRESQGIELEIFPRDDELNSQL
ncbi:hypothetical protein JB92DRAFT_2878067 [Gautieria morchelliformis]|nr:hypothetical protein JB92DRAFT_2878067 [Gautieria morchelliformis]